VADGLNVVSFCLTAKAEEAAPGWLALNGAAPLLGVFTRLSITVPAAMLAPMLAVFAGVFLHIGACELVPRACARPPACAPPSRRSSEWA
jgi:ZIP family zinc transporter